MAELVVIVFFVACIFGSIALIKSLNAMHPTPAAPAEVKPENELLDKVERERQKDNQAGKTGPHAA